MRISPKHQCPDQSGAPRRLGPEGALPLDCLYPTPLQTGRGAWGPAAPERPELSGLLLRQSVVQFLDYLRSEKMCSPITVAGYDLELRKFCSTLKGRAASRETILEFLRAFLKNGDRPAPANRNHRLSIIKSFCKFLIREGLLAIDTDPTRGLEFAKVHRTDPDFLTNREFCSIRDRIDASPNDFYRLRNLAIVETLYGSGLRLHELTSLNVSSLDTENRLFKNVLRKGGDRKDIPLSLQVIDRIHAWIIHRSTIAADDPALFISNRKKRISPRSVQFLVNQIALDAGIRKKVTPHTFRHSFCSEILHRGASIATAKELLNHTSILTTSLYSHTTKKAMRKAVESLTNPSQRSFW